jgi:hypothetical protein
MADDANKNERSRPARRNVDDDDGEDEVGRIETGASIRRSFAPPAG